MNAVTKTIEERLLGLQKHCDSLYKIVSQCSNYTIIKNQFFGIRCSANGDDYEILPPIYDEVIFESPYLISARISDVRAFFDLCSRSWLLDFQPEHSVFNQTLEITVNGKKGLIDPNTRKVLIRPEYDEVTNCISCPYLWVKKGENFHFVRKSDGTFISMINAQFAYDTNEGMFYKESDLIVKCANDNGLDNTALLRKKVVENRGRLQLKNFRYHKIDTIDIYGYIINY